MFGVGGDPTWLRLRSSSPSSTFAIPFVGGANPRRTRKSSAQMTPAAPK